MRKRLLLVLSLSLLIAALLAPAVQAGGGAHCAPDFTDQRTTAVHMAKNCFFPTIARVDVGDEVTFTSKDPVPHTVTGAVYVFGDMEEMLQGDEKKFRFEEEGIFPYVCIIHPGMAGAIVVGDGMGPGDGAIVDTSSYSANQPETSEEESVVEGSATSAFDESEPASIWPNLIAAVIALAILGALSIRFRKRVTAGVTLTTKP